MFQTIHKGLIAFLGLAAVTVLAANSYLLQPLAELAFGRVQKRSGTQIKADAITGNLATGRLALDGMSLARKVEGRNAFELKIGHAVADLSLLRIFEPEWRFDEIHLTGVGGRFEVFEKASAERPPQVGRGIFSVGSAFMRQCTLDIVNHPPSGEARTVRVLVDELRLEEYRSHWSLYDLLFRSKGTGKIQDAPFEVGFEEVEGEHRSTWKVTGLNAESFASRLRGPLGAMRGGKVDLSVVSRWPLGDARKITMTWKLVLQGATPGRDDGSGGSGVLRTWLANRGKDLRLEFDCAVPRDRFDGAESLRDADLWGIVSDAAAEKIRSGAQAAAEAVREKVGAAAATLRDKVRTLFGQGGGSDP